MINGELLKMFIKRHFTVSVIIGLFSGLLSFFLTIIFPATNLQDAELISTSWPQIMKDLFGDPVSAFTSIYGWLYLEVYHITFWMIFGVLASILASYVIAKEIEGKTMDVLLSTPITRIEIILSRFIGIFVLLSVSIIPTIIGCGVGIAVLEYSVNWSILGYISGTGFLLCLNFSAITLIISILISRQIASIFISCSLFGFMFLFEESLVKLIPSIKKLSFLSLFHFYRPDNVLIHGHYSMLNVIILLLVFIVLLSLSLLSFAKKDILT